MASSETKIIFVDGYCHLCHGFIQFILRRDQEKKFFFASLQGTTAQQKIPQHIDVKTIVYLRSDQVLVKSSAVLEILTDLGGIWRIMKIFWIIPNFLRNWIYSLVAHFRYQLFGRKETCELQPRLEDRERLLP